MSLNLESPLHLYSLLGACTERYAVDQYPLVNLIKIE